MSRLHHLLESMRPRQWVKNVLLLAGLYFPDPDGAGPLLFDAREVFNAVMGFIVFCGLSGAVYLINDVVDAPRDRLHPKKRHRPIASGRLDIRTALTAAIVVALLGLIVAYSLSTAFFLLALTYFVMQAAYSLALKEVFLIDTLIIAMGFILRAVAGIIVLRAGGQMVELTPWFVICVLFLSLLLAFCKRRAELTHFLKEGLQTRRVLREYSGAVLDRGIGVCATATILAYALYSVGHERPWHMLSTLPFVIFGVFRYIHLVYAERDGEAPEDLLLGDLSLMSCVALWAVALALVFY